MSEPSVYNLTSSPFIVPYVVVEILKPSISSLVLEFGPDEHTYMYTPSPNVTVEYTGRLQFTIFYHMLVTLLTAHSICTWVYTVGHSPPLIYTCLH